MPVSDGGSKNYFAYEMILLRSLEQDSMLWQTPALAITGQSFLLIFAFTADAPLPGRIAASVLGMFISVMSMQLMAKHRYLHQMDLAKLRDLEQQMGLPQITTRQWGPGVPHQPADGYWRQQRSYPIWIAGLWLFFAFNAYSLAISIYPPIGTWLEDAVHLLGP